MRAADACSGVRRTSPGLSIALGAFGPFGEPNLGDWLQAVRQFGGDTRLYRAVVFVDIGGNGPLEAGLELAAQTPIGIAQVIVDLRIVGAQPHGALQRLDRLV